MRPLCRCGLLFVFLSFCEVKGWKGIRYLLGTQERDGVRS
jgi:hypothetical protein